MAGAVGTASLKLEEPVDLNSPLVSDPKETERTISPAQPKAQIALAQDLGLGQDEI